MASDTRNVLTGAALRLDDLIGLELFVDVVRLGSISAAARAHHLTQPSATERLHRLERRLQMELLRRGPGGSAPTTEGEAVAEWARGVLDAVSRLGDGVAALRGTAAHGSLRIMASLTVAEYVLPRWLQQHNALGGQPVDLAVGNSTTVGHAVMDGDVQLGFVESPRRFVGLRATVVGGDRLTVVVAPSHPWAKRRKAVRPDELADTPLLLREHGSGTRDAFEAALAALGLEHVPPAAVLASTTILKSAASTGGGASVLSELAVQSELALGTLVAVPVDGLDLVRSFRALWRPSANDATVQRFIRLAKSAVVR